MPTAGVDGTQVVIAVSALLTAVVAAVAGVVVAIINSKPKRSAPADVLDSDDWAYVRERVAVVEQQLRDEHATNNIQDRRLDRIERAAGIDGHEWRDR